jgi:hypothetical protein
MPEQALAIYNGAEAGSTMFTPGQSDRGAWTSVPWGKEEEWAMRPGRHDKKGLAGWLCTGVPCL